MTDEYSVWVQEPIGAELREIPTGPAPPVAWDPDDHVYKVVTGGGGGGTVPGADNELRAYIQVLMYALDPGGVPPPAP